MPQGTKAALKEALKKLLKSKPLNKIKINDITGDCGVNRMTFYYHFHDIYELVEWSVLDEIKKSLGADNVFVSWEEGLLGLLTAVRKSKSFMTDVYRSIDRGRAENYILELLREYSVTISAKRSENITVSEKETAFITDFYLYAITGTVINWIENGMTDEPEYIVEMTKALVCGGISSAEALLRTKHTEDRKNFFFSDK